MVLDIQTDRQTDIQTDRQKYGPTDNQTSIAASGSLHNVIICSYTRAILVAPLIWALPPILAHCGGRGLNLLPKKILKKPNIPKYVQVLVVTWAKPNSVAALLSPHYYEDEIYNPHLDLNCVVQLHSLSFVCANYVILADDDQ